MIKIKTDSHTVDIWHGDIHYKGRAFSYLNHSVILYGSDKERIVIPISQGEEVYKNNTPLHVPYYFRSKKF